MPEFTTMPEDLYGKIVAALCSPHFHTERVEADVFYRQVSVAVEIGNLLDQTKKTIFYGAAPADVIGETVCELLAPIHPDAVHAILGMFTESVELLERLIKMIENPNADHKLNLIEELGDLDWYAQLLRNTLQITSEEHRLANARKLFRRYPDKMFAAAKAHTRDLASEEEALRGS